MLQGIQIEADRRFSQKRFRSSGSEHACELATCSDCQVFGSSPSAGVGGVRQLSGTEVMPDFRWFDIDESLCLCGSMARQ